MALIHKFAAAVWLLLATMLVACDGTGGPDVADTGHLTLVTDSGRHVYEVELALTPEAQARGLMFRREMAPDHGMLFDFHESREAHFWMRNTYLPLDMIFITADGHVYRIAANTEPLSERIVPSNGPVRAVLELNAGAAEAIGLKPGDVVEHPVFSE
ncbi:MAG: DUF192 domain-containing protein [Hyphomicrobiales bacterium]